MSEFKKVSTVDDLNGLDSDEIVLGYRAGSRGEDTPGSDKSRAYWHGWRNGMADTGRIPVDWEMSALANDVLRHTRETGQPIFLAAEDCH